MRLFFGIYPPKSVIDEAVAIRDRLTVPGARWVDPTKMHVTLQFLGEQQEDAQFIALGEGVAQRHAPFAIGLEGVGDFGGHALWIGVRDAAPLVALACDLGAVDYHPHLTFARMKHAPKYEGAGSTAAFSVSSFDLIESRGGAYHTRRSFTLSRTPTPP